jgi:protein TonB
MEQKKTPKVDVARMRTTGFLMGLVLVLASLYVALEWNSVPREDDVAALDLSELMHESELVPMSNEEVMTQIEEKKEGDEAEEIHVVDDDVEIEQPDEEQGNEGDEDESVLRDLVAEDDKALASLNVDPQNPLNFHIVEDLPQYPGGAVELMKWLTKNLRYPSVAQQQKVQGRVVAVFYVEKDGSITGINIVRSLSPECDQEALRVLKMMPHWKPGIQYDQPCRTKVQIPIVFKL